MVSTHLLWHKCLHVEEGRFMNDMIFILWYDYVYWSQVVRRAALGDLRVRRDALSAHPDNGGSERSHAGLQDGAAGALPAGDV